MFQLGPFECVDYANHFLRDGVGVADNRGGTEECMHACLFFIDGVYERVTFTQPMICVPLSSSLFGGKTLAITVPNKPFLVLP